ncbi:hypothetical protein [Halorientalis brevis]|uniref:hypothetical protein n=1 Tax=Halorientalis brevis TaxID=1126241 RepID=UPI0036D3BE0B
MVAELVLSFALGFVVLVAASYVGTTMALRGFFGREYYNPENRQFTISTTDGPRETGDENQ